MQQATRVSYRASFVFAAAHALAFSFLACDGSDKPPKPFSEARAPILRADPPPGSYTSYVLDVRIEAEEPGVELLFGIDHAAEVTGATWYAGAIDVVHLVDSAAVYVTARDERGRVWGPYTFEYRLRSRDTDGACRIAQPQRVYYRGDEAIPLNVIYSLPTALAEVQLLVDGELAAAYASPEDPRGMVTIDLPPLVTQGSYLVQCRVDAPNREVVLGTASMTLFVDTEPPLVGWLNEAPWVAPTHFRLQATDVGGSGLARAEVCDSGAIYCLPMRADLGGVFSFMTAFLPGNSAGFGLRALVYDVVGNVTELVAPYVFASELPPVQPPFLGVITLTTAPTFDLGPYLASAGIASLAEVRSLDFSPLASEAVPLEEGWNEVLFRRADSASWDTVGIYRAGVSIDLPARDPLANHHWLIYASTSTVPVLQAQRVATWPVTSPTWQRAWFDVPRLFFVEDLDDDSVWDDGEPVFEPVTTAATGPWLARGTPLVAPLAPLAISPTAVTQSAQLQCADCAAGKTLRLQRRATRVGSPLERASWPAIDLAAWPVTTHSFRGEPAEHCLFFWDEDANGLPSGDEPRAGARCDAADFTLGRAEPLALTPVGHTLTIAGIPFGRSVTGYAAVLDGNGDALLRTPVGPVNDLDGTGLRESFMPPDGRFPVALTLWSGSDSRQVNLPGMPSPVTTRVRVAVFTDGGAKRSAAVESWTPAVRDYRVFDAAATSSVLLAVDPQYNPRVRALRDGFVSRWVYVDTASLGGEPASIPLISAGSAGWVLGYVSDTLGLPVADAVVEWDADPYGSRSHTNAAGWFLLPVLGDGTLTIGAAEGEARSSHRLNVAIGETYQVDVTLPANTRPSWPMGLLSTLRPVAVTGSAPVTLYTNSVYAWARLADGPWVLRSELGIERQFAVPGALPGIHLANPAWLTLRWTPQLLESALFLRCGARRQPFAFGVSPLVDSPCWEWYAGSGANTFYIGRPDPVGGMPDAGLQTLVLYIRSNGNGVAFATVRLRDLIFNRTITLTADVAGSLRAVLPHGYYAVVTTGGSALLDVYGAPARVALDHAGTVSATVNMP